MGDRFHTRESMTFNVSGADIEVREADDGDGLTLAGYIARFNEPTHIEDWLGSYTEEIKRGAFARTLVDRGPAKIKMQFNHGSDPTFGALPIGVWTDMREDRKGLWGEGRVLDTWHTAPIRAAIEKRALDGMSFKFKVIGESWRKADGKTAKLDHRTLTEIAMYEAGVVVHQAYEGTTVALRSQGLDLCRSYFEARGFDAHNEDDRADTLHVEAAVVPVDDTDPDRSEADPPVGITRQAMSLKVEALLALGVVPSADPHRGAA